ncbi:MAG: thiamine pyrophosphate-binding protein, partial [Gammaproteobacteria bacterium]|nr:thiamine pyrophosphate-binding protein [Gammaproteobacteria bacterium]
MRALQRQFGPEAIFTADSGNGTFLAVEHLRLDRPGRFLAPVDYSCMGYSVPAAIGAALANPGTKTIALAGDGAFLMTGLELLTAAHEGLPVLALVLRDRELAQIAQFQDVALNRKVGSRLPDFDVARICEAIGVECLQLEGDGEIDDVLRTAD